MEDAEYANQVHSETTTGVDDMLAHNMDLGERLKQSRVTAEYDLEDDLLEITFDDVREASSLAVGVDLWFRLDFESAKIVGLEVCHYRTHVDRNSPVHRMVRNLLSLAGVTAFTVPVPSATNKGGNPLKDIQELALAR